MAFAWFFANLSLSLLIKVLLIEKKTCISREIKKNGHFQLMSLTETYQFFFFNWFFWCYMTTGIQIQRGKATGILIIPQLANPNLIPRSNTYHSSTTIRNSSKGKQNNINKNRIKKFTIQKDDTLSTACLWGQLQSTSILPTIENVILTSWRDTTKKKYQYII